MNEQVSLEDLYKIIYDKNDLSNAVIEINDECNFKCDHCYLGNKTKSFMSLELFKKIIDELYNLECLSILITGGEPFMNPAFIDMYIYAIEMMKVNEDYKDILIMSFFNIIKKY